MCELCRVRGWRGEYCLEEADQASMVTGELPPQDLFIRVSEEDKQALCELYHLHSDKDSRLELIFRISPDRLMNNPNVLGICKQLGIGLEVFHAPARPK